MLEIYNETIRDLLAASESSGAAAGGLDIGQNKRGETLVRGLTVLSVETMADVVRGMDLASAHRTVSGHSVNDRSSRSHLVVTVNTTVRHPDGTVTRASLNLIDLAGSERVSKTEVTGDALKEAQHINKSLSALGDVIAALAARSKHVPFRNSKLTYMLQDSLSGSSKVAMYLNVSPVMWNSQETICSLRFGARCRSVQLGKAKKTVVEAGPGGGAGAGVPT